MKLKVLFLALGLLFANLGEDQADDEDPKITVASDVYRQTLASAIDKAQKTGFEEGLETPGLNSMPDDQFEALVAKIKMDAPIPGVSLGERGVKYDVILQPGHYGRPPEKGNLGASGHLVSERELAAYITNIVAQRLIRDHNKVLVISADKFLRSSRDYAFDGLKTKVFLAIHFEGSEVRCAAHPSLGYQKQSYSSWGMHALGFSLASALGYDLKKFANDNYTSNLANYYMFRQLKGDMLTGILEVDEITCDKKERELIARSNLIGENIGYALNNLVKTPNYEEMK